MKKLTNKETDTMVALLRRAIANNQLQLAHAVSHAEFGIENDGEFEIDDTHSGCVSCSDKWPVDSAIDGDTMASEVCIYVQNDDLQFLAHGELSEKQGISRCEVTRS